MRRRSFQRWTEACLLLLSFGALSVWGIVSVYSTALDTWASREVEALAQTARARVPRPLVEGELVGRIEIPRLSMSAVLLEGVSASTLRVAAGHVPGTALPGAAGNVAVAAHRDSFFRKLAGIRLGDRIVVTTARGKHVYRVAFTEIVRPRDTRVLGPTREETLTLLTCYPFHYVGPAPKRFVVRAARTDN